MYSNKGIESAIYSLYSLASELHFCTEKEAEELFDSMNDRALSQALRYMAETVYVFTAQGQSKSTFNYRGEELFHQRATLLCSQQDLSIGETIKGTRGLELWMLEDGKLAVVACIAINHEEGTYVTEYRTIKGDNPWDGEMCMDLQKLTESLKRLYAPFIKNEFPIYEL